MPSEGRKLFEKIIVSIFEVVITLFFLCLALVYFLNKEDKKSEEVIKEKKEDKEFYPVVCDECVKPIHGISFFEGGIKK